MPNKDELWGYFGEWSKLSPEANIEWFNLHEVLGQKSLNLKKIIELVMVAVSAWGEWGITDYGWYV